MRNDPFLQEGEETSDLQLKLTKHDLKVADLDQVRIEVGKHGYFRTLDLAERFRIPVRHFHKWLKNGAYGGRKVGRYYIISEDQFKAFVESGGLDNFHRRPGRNKDKDYNQEAVEEARESIAIADKEFEAWQHKQKEQ